MTNLEQLETDMIRLSELKEQLKAFDELKKEYEIVRQSVLMGMQAMKSKRTEPINGYFAVRSERPTIRITNEREVESWLKEHDFDPEEFKTISAARFDPIAKAALKSDGELIKGTELELNEYVTIKESK